MSEMKLKQIDVKGLKVFTNPCDLRKDLHLFVDYVRNRDVKRSTRGNGLPKVDAKRLAKLISDPSALEEVEDYGRSRWLDYVDEIALNLGFVSYDTEGQYLGYSSKERSYPDNYIEIDEKEYNSFLALTLQGQENLLVESLVGKYEACHNEFFETGVMGTLDTFDSFGCATGVLPLLNFDKSRIFLLEIIKRCQAGVWYSVASLVQYLKSEHPYFLIPEKPRYRHQSDRSASRYKNFRERKKDSWGHRFEIDTKDSNAFERVEGRYVERFLEGIPLTLGYVDLAYGESKYKERKPSLNLLRAFKVSEGFQRFMEGNIPDPRVTVQPNFEIHVESEFYPAGILTKLNSLSDTLSSDTVTILKLNKKKVSAELANDDSLDVVSLLYELSDSDLPQNVLTELEEWVGHSEVFTLYHGFGLLEGDPDLIQAKPFTVKSITPTLSIVKKTGRSFCQAGRSGTGPLYSETFQ